MIELLKNFVWTGFGNIETIDLDTIDVNNLNRQFLFGKKNCNKSKSKIALLIIKKFSIIILKIKT